MPRDIEEDYDSEEEELVTRLEDFEPPVQVDTSFSKFIIIDNIPITDKEKIEKLNNVLRTFITKTTGAELASFHIPFNAATNKNKGYCFAEFAKRDQAVEAVKRLDNIQFDKAHALRANLLDDHKTLTNISETYVAPTAKEYVEKEDHYQWLYSNRSLKGFDQFALRYGDTTEICWNEMKMGKPISEKVQNNWTSTYVQWSNSGSYLVTIHKEGVALYGGESWSQIGLFKHNNVMIVDFSPEDKYMITFAPPESPKDQKSIIVWDVRSGRPLRGFPSPPKDQFQWPVFSWSAKDTFFAKQSEGGIDIYEAFTCNMLKNKTYPIANLKSFTWSPTDPYICYFVPATATMPGRIVIAEVPTMKTLAEKSIWEATDARMHWQNQGDYLCVKVDRSTAKPKKTNQPLPTNFELFRMHETNIPIENFEVPGAIKAFAWEPRGKKLCIIYGEHRTEMTVAFFEVQKNKVILLTKLEHRKLNSIYWSPRGTYIVLAQVGDTGELEFYNTASLETMATDEHMSCTQIDWNPSGRYVTSTVSFFKVQTDTGYKIWTFAGEPVYQVLKDRFKQFTWRPRPPMILTSDQLKSIQNRTKEYAKRFKAEDDAEAARIKAEEDGHLNVLMQEFLNLLQKGEREYQELAPLRQKLNIHEDIESADEYDAFEKVEEIIDVTTQPVKK
ncbi:hypothetical protein SAMD00019534_070840 [Acytostelium subglobosum LB1]|uniref:hypothetical protein n=1 Tax=Acytostelium subglobosum LB1 TaxID=1410327 RepID=UPI000644A6D1|nr:hypothetical protein SAMD00019534_070840 [Acytostelium subglobosum LB1]GAM23909.1 hypothetical protein SAMD00019534_070840 [Acytostelium subglobosum LB1]|eukprot:XP_012752945.1 hypothetical protein SAMD00019534_070840 [Acytostelium subglobosum LB1]